MTRTLCSSLAAVVKKKKKQKTTPFTVVELRPAARTVVCLSKAIVGEATNVNAQSPT